METPTPEQLDEARRVLEKVLRHTKENEPYAFQFIEALETVVEQFPETLKQ